METETFPMTQPGSFPPAGDLSKFRGLDTAGEGPGWKGMGGADFQALGTQLKLSLAAFPLLSLQGALQAGNRSQRWAPKTWF